MQKFAKINSSDHSSTRARFFIPRRPDSIVLMLTMSSALGLGPCGGGGSDTTVPFPVTGAAANPAVASVPPTAPSAPTSAVTHANAGSLPADKPYAGTEIFSAAAEGFSENPAEPSATTHHTMTVGGTSFNYTATMGQLLARADYTSKPLARISYVAFTRDGMAPGKRAITFIYGDGLGGSSAPLMLKAWGPRIIAGTADKAVLTDNPDTLLADSDLVFVNPVGTGYSVAIQGSTNDDFWPLDTDADATARFIARYLDLNGRLNSPKFLFGDGIGGSRAALLSYKLRAGQNINVNGLTLSSPAWNISPADHRKGALFPTLAATSRYLGRLPAQQQNMPMVQFMDAAKEFAGDYLASDASTRRMNADLSVFLDVLKNDAAIQLKPTPSTFPDALPDYDNRYGSLSALLSATFSVGNKYPDFRDTRRLVDEASFLTTFSTASDPAEVRLLTSYLHNELQFTEGSEFVIHNAKMDSLTTRNEYVKSLSAKKAIDVIPSTSLHSALLLSSTLKLKVFDGTYDATQPFFRTDLEIADWKLPANSAGNVEHVVYESGYAPHFDAAVRPAMQASMRGFYASTLLSMGAAP